MNSLTHCGWEWTDIQLVGQNRAKKSRMFSDHFGNSAFLFKKCTSSMCSCSHVNDSLYGTFASSKFVGNHITLGFHNFFFQAQFFKPLEFRTSVFFIFGGPQLIKLAKWVEKADPINFWVSKSNLHFRKVEMSNLLILAPFDSREGWWVNQRFFFQQEYSSL